MPLRNRSKSSSRRAPLADDILSAGILRTPNKKRKARHDGPVDNAETNLIDPKASRKILKIGRGLQDEEEEEEEEGSRKSKPDAAFTISSRQSFVPGMDDSDKDEEDDSLVDQTYTIDGGEAWTSDEDEVVHIDADADIDPADLALFNKFMPSDRQHDVPLEAVAQSMQVSGDAPRAVVAQADTTTGGISLADLILEKIAAHEAMQAAADASTGVPPLPLGAHPNTLDNADEEIPELPPKVIEVYSKIALLLSRYKSGPLPKPLKILPRVPAAQLPELLDLTRPQSWTPHACYAATRVFVSAAPGTVQYFLNSVLLPRVRKDIRESRKLNVHLYAALRKALYKPAAFFKGIVFPLLDPDQADLQSSESTSGFCTLREAMIISSVLARTSVPVLHSAAAMLRLTEIAAELTPTLASSRQTTARVASGDNLGPFGAVNVFILTLLRKKYALPFKVVDALVFHFLRYKNVGNVLAADSAAGSVQNAGSGVDSTGAAAGNGPGGGAGGGFKLPVLWHQTLLAFAQRYKNDITEDQREALLDLVQIGGGAGPGAGGAHAGGGQGHKMIGPEVRRELLAGRGANAGNAGGAGGASAMIGVVGGAGGASAMTGAAGGGGGGGGDGDDTMMLT